MSDVDVDSLVLCALKKNWPHGAHTPDEEDQRQDAGEAMCRARKRCDPTRKPVHYLCKVGKKARLKSELKMDRQRARFIAGLDIAALDRAERSDTEGVVALHRLTESLTPRGRQIAERLFDGAERADIAAEAEVTVQTVYRAATAIKEAIKT